MPTALPTASPEVLTWRRARYVLIPAVVMVLGPFAAIRVVDDPALWPALDNVHWTTAYVAAAIMAWLGVRSASAHTMASRRCFAWGLTLSAIGQLIWDIQTVIDWNPFPAPSTVFYIWLGPACALGIWAGVRAHAAKVQRRTIALDTAALVVALLALTLALYLPKRGDIEALPMNVLVAYPVGLFSAAAIGVVAVLGLRLKPDRRVALMLLSLVGCALVWLEWNSVSMHDTPPDGSWLNLGFSVIMLCLGIGAMTWDTAVSTDARWERFCEGALRLLPLLLVVIAATSVVLVWVLPGVPGGAQIPIGLGAVVVLVLAVARQSMLLSERDQMQELESRFRALFETAQDSIFIMNDREFMDCNPSTLRMFGCTREQIIGHSPIDFSPAVQPDQQASLDKARVKIAAAIGGEPQFFEWKHRKFDGTLFDAEVSLNRVQLRGRFLLQAIVRDVTGRKQVDEQLRARTAFFEAQVDSAIDGIIVVDSSGRKVLQNRRMAEVWKIPDEIAQDPDDARQVRFVTTRTKNPQAFAAKVAHLYSHPTEISRDIIELVDGTILDRYSAPVRDDRGKFYGRIWAFRDITEQRRLEDQLRQSQKMEAVGQLAGGIAHDFNNLLTAILGHVGLLRTDREVPAHMNESLEEISRAANRASNLTSQLLAFSRLQVISIRVLELNEVVAHLTKMLRRLLGEHIAMQLEPAAERLLFEGDTGMIEQVLINLAVNARDAMPGGGTLRIATSGELRRGPAAEGLPGEAGQEPYVCLTISDTGTGIAPEIRTKIFEPFFTTKGVGKGTGLGLATAFGIVQQHRGWIELDSEVGRGATFRIFLPRVNREPEVYPAAAAAAPARGQGETILLVEDEAAVREIGVRALTARGYRVLAAADGQAALALWAQHRATITLLFTDVIMPGGITGLQLARQLQAEAPGLRVIYTSGYSKEIAGRELTADEAANYLAKPYEIDQLFRLVRATLDARPGRGPLARLPDAVDP